MAVKEKRKRMLDSRRRKTNCKVFSIRNGKHLSLTFFCGQGIFLLRLCLLQLGFVEAGHLRNIGLVTHGCRSGISACRKVRIEGKCQPEGVNFTFLSPSTKIKGLNELYISRCCIFFRLFQCFQEAQGNRARVSVEGRCLNLSTPNIK